MLHPITMRLVSVVARKEGCPGPAWDTGLVGEALEKALCMFLSLQSPKGSDCAVSLLCHLLILSLGSLICRVKVLN